MSPEPDDRTRIEQLERENRALRSANAKLMRERLGSGDTAAAARLAEAAPARPSPLRRLRLAARRAALRLLR